MKSDFMLYVDYPFDCPIFTYRFELSHFAKKYMGETLEYRFDFYEQSNNSITYKESLDNMPELDIDFLTLPHLKEIHEHKTHPKGGMPGRINYFPGFTLTVHTVRDPFPKAIRIFLPVLILGIFLYKTFVVEEFHDRLNNLALCLLTFIAIMENMRQDLPDISALTVADKFIMTYIVMSLGPLLDNVLGFFFMSGCRYANVWLNHEILCRNKYQIPLSEEITEEHLKKADFDDCVEENDNI